MDPMSVLRILWRHKLVALPFVVLTIALFTGALFFGPRAYQATASYAMITPSLPSAIEIESSPALGAATDNPYLRSADPTLVLQVGKTRLSSEESVRTLQSEGLSTDFVVGSGLSTSAQILTITANAESPEVAVRSAQRLGEILDDQIRQVQLVNGASERYLITVQTINEATGAAERVSSRLRNAAVAGIGGVVLLIAAVATARVLDERRSGTTRSTPDTRVVAETPTTVRDVSHQPQNPVRRDPMPHRPADPPRPLAPRTGPPRIAPSPPVRRGQIVTPPANGHASRLGARPAPVSQSPRSK
jgi:hypothetical protein